MEFQGKTFLVKEKSILLDGIDITNNLDVFQKEAIFKKAKDPDVRIVNRNTDKENSISSTNKEKTVLREAKHSKNDIESIEEISKNEKAIIKGNRKREKELRDKKRLEKKKENEFKTNKKKLKKQKSQIQKKEKAKKSLNKAAGKYSSATKKYEKLKEKGKLSPVDEKKWLKKLKH